MTISIYATLCIGGEGALTSTNPADLATLFKSTSLSSRTRGSITEGELLKARFGCLGWETAQAIPLLVL